MEKLKHFCLLLIILLLFGCGQAEAENDKNAWTKLDTALQITYASFHCMDWAQTLHMARNPDKFEEGNPVVRAIIGRHPSEGDVNALLASTLVLHTAIAYWLPKEAIIFREKVPARTIWQSVWIGIEATTVAKSTQIGIKIRF